MNQVLHALLLNIGTLISGAVGRHLCQLLSEAPETSVGTYAKARDVVCFALAAADAASQMLKTCDATLAGECLVARPEYKRIAHCTSAQKDSLIIPTSFRF